MPPPNFYAFSYKKWTLVPCRALNPEDSDIEIKLRSVSTGEELPDVIQLDPKIGFKIQNGRLPEHNGEIECIATKFNQTDSVRFTLNFIFGPNPVNPVTPPPNCENYRHSDQIIALMHYYKSILLRIVQK